MSSFKDHFSSNAAGYATYRPTYPASLVTYLAAVAPGRDLAIDCGCGTGQLSVPLAERFTRVVATDASASQIANAQPHPRVEYRVGAAEDTGEPSQTADLITVAQAAHWLDLDVFYREVRRVVRPGGIVALITYGVVHVAAGDVDRVVQDFYANIIGTYWPPERRHVDSGYRDLPFPFEELSAPPLDIEVTWSRAAFLGYVDTWSAVRAAEKAVGPEVVERFARMLSAHWPDDERHVVRWPLSLRVGRV